MSAALTAKNLQTKNDHIQALPILKEFTKQINYGRTRQQGNNYY